LVVVGGAGRVVFGQAADLALRRIVEHDVSSFAVERDFDPE